MNYGSGQFVVFISHSVVSHCHVHVSSETQHVVRLVLFESAGLKEVFIRVSGKSWSISRHRRFLKALKSVLESV